MDSQKSKNAFGSNLLATLNFPIKGSGSPLLINGASLSASKHGYTEQELKIQKLWGEMRKKYQKDGLTDEDALRNAISQKTGIPANDIHLPDYTDYEEEKFTLERNTRTNGSRSRASCFGHNSTQRKAYFDTRRKGNKRSHVDDNVR